MGRKPALAAVVIILTIAFIGAGDWAVALAASTTPDAVQGMCNEKGGFYFSPGGANGAYGCLYGDGTVQVCGGTKQGCDTYPPPKATTITGLPTGGKISWDIAGVLLAVQNQVKLDEVSAQIQSLQDSIDTLNNELSQIIP